MPDPSGAPYLFASIILCALMLAVSISDMRTRTIPNTLVAVVGALGVVCGALSIPFPAEGVALPERLLAALLCGAPFVGAALFGASVGGGDIKLLAAAGCVLGVRHGIIALALGSVLAALWALYLRFGRGYSSQDTFAMGPFLCMGVLLSALVI